jgi:hypothetical protein
MSGDDLQITRMLGAGICYADLDPRLWRSCLQSIATSGFNWIDVIVPWRTHTVSSHQFDFSNGLDLHTFLNLAADAGLKANLRVGPCPALTRPQFGLPDYVLNSAAMLARTHHGTPMWVPSPARLVAVPSYDSEAFVVASAQWMSAVAGHSSDCRAVSAITFDVGDHWFFRDACLDGDFHPESWNDFHNRTRLSRDQIVTATATAAHRSYWLEWKQQRAQRFALALAQRTNDLWPNVARFAAINGSASMQQRRSVAAAVQGGIVLQSFLGGSDADMPALSFVDQQCPTIIELPAAQSVWLPPPAKLRLAKKMQNARTARPSGVMLAGWIPSEHEVATDRTAFGSILSQAGQSTTALPSQVALVIQLDHAIQLQATAGIDPVPPSLLNLLGLDQASLQPRAEQTELMRYRQWVSVTELALQAANIMFDIVDDSASADDLRKYQVIIAPSTTRIRRAFAQILKDIADNRTATIVMGPQLPSLDQDGVTLPTGALPSRVGKLRQNSLDDVAGLSADLAALRQS